MSKDKKRTISLDAIRFTVSDDGELLTLNLPGGDILVSKRGLVAFNNEGYRVALDLDETKRSLSWREWLFVDEYEFVQNFSQSWPMITGLFSVAKNTVEEKARRAQRRSITPVIPDFDIGEFRERVAAHHRYKPEQPEQPEQLEQDDD
jgi:hypothetical protein